MPSNFCVPECHLFLLYWKRIIHLSVAHFAPKRNLIVKKCKELKLRRLRRKQRTRWVNDGENGSMVAKHVLRRITGRRLKEKFSNEKTRILRSLRKPRPHIFPEPKSPNRRALPVEKKVAFTLYYLKDTGSMWMTANTFGIHQCTVSKVVLEVCNAIAKHLGPEYIHLPFCFCYAFYT